MVLPIMPSIGGGMVCWRKVEVNREFTPGVAKHCRFRNQAILIVWVCLFALRGKFELLRKDLACPTNYLRRIVIHAPGAKAQFCECFDVAAEAATHKAYL